MDWINIPASTPMVAAVFSTMAPDTVLTPKTLSRAPLPAAPLPYRTSGRAKLKPGAAVAAVDTVCRACSCRVPPLATTTLALVPRGAAVAMPFWALRKPAAMVVWPVNVLALPRALVRNRVPAPSLLRLPAPVTWLEKVAWLPLATLSRLLTPLRVTAPLKVMGSAPAKPTTLLVNVTALDSGNGVLDGNGRPDGS